MIVKLERTQSNAQLNMEQTQNPTMGVTVNNESTKHNLHLRTDSSLATGMFRCILLVPNLHPRSCCCLNTKDVLSQKNNLIK